MRPLEHKRVLIVIARNDFRDEEFKLPKTLLEEQGAKITVASSDLAISKGKLGMKVQPDILLEEASARDYDAIIFVGGSGAAEYFDDVNAHKLTQDAVKFNKTVGAICIAPVILAQAGVLDGKKATVFPSESQNLGNKVSYTGVDVERDGHIITANGPQAAREFGLVIAGALTGK